jgi:hypothetical protein
MLPVIPAGEEAVCWAASDRRVSDVRELHVGSRVPVRVL